MICLDCRKQHHHLCRGSCDCQHRGEPLWSTRHREQMAELRESERECFEILLGSNWRAEMRVMFGDSWKPV